MSLQTQTLDHLVDQLNNHTSASRNGSHAVVALSAAVVVNLGFDPKETVTRESLLKALSQHFQRQLDDNPDLVLDSAEVLELRDEG